MGLEWLRGFLALSVILYTTVHPYFICVIKNQSDFKYVELADYILSFEYYNRYHLLKIHCLQISLYLLSH